MSGETASLPPPLRLCSAKDREPSSGFALASGGYLSEILDLLMGPKKVPVQGQQKAAR